MSYEKKRPKGQGYFLAKSRALPKNAPTIFFYRNDGIKWEIMS
jgi:hypothetical protein